MRSALLVVSGAALGLTVALFTAVFIPSAGAQAPPGGGAGAGGGAMGGENMVMGTSGDSCWVLAKARPAKGPERTVLCLYRQANNGANFELKDVRWIDPDLLIKGELVKEDTWPVQKVLKELPKEEQEALNPKD